MAIYILKKDNVTKELYDPSKIKRAVCKSAKRVLKEFSSDELDLIESDIYLSIIESQKDCIPIIDMHSYVEHALDKYFPAVAQSYRNYRNYKTEFVKMLDSIYTKAQSIMYIGDKDNSNTDSALVCTKRSLTLNALNKELYRKFFLSNAEIEASDDGYIYIHDMSFRRDTMNCCLFDIESVLNGGFEMGNIWYNEPTKLRSAFDVIGDLVLSVSAQQYGGFTVPEIDNVLSKYAKKSHDKYIKRYQELGLSYEDASSHALEDLETDFMQGFQVLEYKFNTVGSSRGDYPFTTITIGLCKDMYAKMAAKACLKVRAMGQGKEGHKKPVLFPKIVFLYDKELHGDGKPLNDVFNEAILCSSKAMYPDYLSLSGEGYVPSIYKKYKEAISPMGCRAFLSPFYERGGLKPEDENDKPIFKGRFNIGVVSLHLPMIYMKAKEENKPFFEVLDYYLEMIRQIHLRTYDYLGEMRASTNPLAYCEGGFYGGHLKPNDKIKPLLDSATASFGYTALNELQRLYNGKSLVEDREFALNTLRHINEVVEKYKYIDNRLYAIYGTPAESLCGLQVTQFRKKYGIIKNVSDRGYVSNSFHCHVTENITPFEKQDIEREFWNLSNGGKIQYVKYPIDYNINAIKALVLRAMDYGFYEGVNLSLSYCDDCGHSELNMDICPKCGSKNLTKIERMNGYLSYSRIHGDTRLNKAKMEEISERKSM
ncbi:MAG: anaerobic ribonucleoside-triphosphate reductase [Anaeroplasmataceae bacterium]